MTFAEELGDLSRTRQTMVTFNHPRLFVLNAYIEKIFNSLGLQLQEYNETLLPDPLLRNAILPITQFVVEENSLAYAPVEIAKVPDNLAGEYLDLRAFVIATYTIYENQGVPRKPSPDKETKDKQKQPGLVKGFFRKLRKSRENQSFIFTHIPKCGGTSFRELLYRSAISSGLDEHEFHIPGVGSTHFSKNMAQLDAIELEELQGRDLKVLACHCDSQVLSEFKLRMKDPYFFVIFRDPVKRMISHYNFFNCQLGGNDCKDLTLNDLTEERLDWVLNRFRNLQLRFVVGQKMANGMGVDQLLAEGKRNISERYDSYYLLGEEETVSSHLKDKLPDWFTIVEEPLRQLNSGGVKYQVREEIVEKIKEYNAVEIEFIEHCRSLR